MRPIIFSVAAALTSCAVSGDGESKLPAYCRYNAVSPAASSNLPREVFVFPPLLANKDGKTLEALSPVMTSTGEIGDWACPSAQSKKIRAAMSHELEKRGFEVVDFQRVTDAEWPHSVLMLSLSYTRPVKLDPQREGAPEMLLMTMVRAKTFGANLDPASARVISNVDGATFFHSSDPQAEITDQSFKVILDLMGDNVSGYINFGSSSE